MGLEKERLVMKKKISQKLWSRLSEDQRRFFVSDAGYTGRSEKFTGWRFELNALTPEQLIAYIEQNLKKYGLTEKVIPGREVISGHVLQAAEKAFREKVLEEVNTMIDVKKIVEEIAARNKIETGSLSMKLFRN